LAGDVRLKRLRPAVNAFTYPRTFDAAHARITAPQWRTVRYLQPARVVGLFDQDHGDGGPNALVWLDDLLQRRGVEDANGGVWLHYPRVLGHLQTCEFWYCHTATGAARHRRRSEQHLHGGIHCWTRRYGPELTTNKVFHVSLLRRGGYRFSLF
jgi:DUF1365 family protein